MLSTMTSRQAMSWALGGDADLQPRWLQELQSQENLQQIDQATKFVHIRRGSKTWSTVLQQIQDSYKLNYVEVEIGPPKPGRDGAERGPFIKLSGGSSEVNYSTIVFPDRDKKADTAGAENRNSVGNGTSKAHQKLERKNSKKLALQLKKQKLLQQQQQMQEQELLLQQQAQQLYSEQPQTADQENLGDDNNIILTPPTSPVSRVRALSTPTRNRKFPTEAELADAIKARQDRKDHDPSATPPKTRTLPTREKLWLEEGLQAPVQAQEPVIMSKKDNRPMKEGSLDGSTSSQAVKSAELSHAMRAMQLKVRRKSSGENYPFDFSIAPEHPMYITKSSSFGPQDLSITGQEPCAEIFVDDTKQSKPPVLKKSKSELEKAFARRKKGHKSGDSDPRLASSGDNSPCESEASSPRDLAEPKSAKEKLRFNFQNFFKSKSRGSPDGQSMKASSSPVAIATETKAQQESLDSKKQPYGRKPVPLPRGQGRESSIESITDVPISPKYGERPMPSPPNQVQQQQQQQQPQQQQQQQLTQPSHAWIDSPSFHQSEDEMYMNVAFSKPNKLQLSTQPVQHVMAGHSPGQSGASSPGQEQQPLHRYENVFLEDRLERLSGTQDRPSSSDSPRGSIEMHRPVPAPRFHGSTGGHASEVTTTTTSSYGSHPGHCRQESWGNAATFASHGIPPSSHHCMSPKHESPTGSPRLNELSNHLKNSIANSLATVHNSHFAQSSMVGGRTMSAEGVNLKPKSSNQGMHGGLGSRSSGSLDGHSSTSNHSSGESGNRGNRGHRGSNASLVGGAGSKDGSSVNMRRKMSQDRMPPPSFATQSWYYGRMLRQECEYLMLSQGESCQYLVRDSSHRVGDLMLSVLHDTKVHHYVIQTTQEGKFQIAHHDFNSVEDILEFYHHHVIMYSPLTQEPVYLKDPFLLNH